MSKTQLLYTGTEAVALAKEYYPETWNQIIEEKQTILKRIRKTWKLKSYDDAYTKFVSYGCKGDSAILSFAALQLLKDEEKAINESIGKQVEVERVKVQTVIDQQLALETQQIGVKDKNILRQYYASQIEQINGKITELCNAITVVGAVHLRVQGNLFLDVQSQ